MTARTSLIADPAASMLGVHVRQCDRARERAFALYAMGERVQTLLRPRFFTTVLATAAVLMLFAGGI